MLLNISYFMSLDPPNTHLMKPSIQLELYCYLWLCGELTVFKRFLLSLNCRKITFETEKDGVSKGYRSLLPRYRIFLFFDWWNGLLAICREYLSKWNIKQARSKLYPYSLNNLICNCMIYPSSSLEKPPSCTVIFWDLPYQNFMD